MTVPVLWEVENGEATGHTMRFCSDRCRDSMPSEGMAKGVEDVLDAPPDEQCHTCGKTLDPAA